jgi:hypothetical protein
MSQGKVIAVKPLSSVSTELMYARSSGAAGSSMRDTGESEGNLVYIQVFEGKGKKSSPRKAKSVVWYEDVAGELNIGDYVDFDINNNRTRPIKGAENVEKIGFPYAPINLLSRVVLLASLVFIFAAVLDNKR